VGCVGAEVFFEVGGCGCGIRGDCEDKSFDAFIVLAETGGAK
jgi:hypothetical protein